MSTPRIRTIRSYEVERTTGTHDVLDRLFVYGTMLSGQTARSIVANSVSRSMPAVANGYIYAFPMGYPGFVDTRPSGLDQPGKVVGEVLWLTDLAASFALLDAYEGADFARVITQVTITSGQLANMTIWTWIYTLADPAAIAHGLLIPDGDWTRHWQQDNA